MSAARMLRNAMTKKSRNVMWMALGASVGLSLGLAGGVLADKAASLGKDLPWADAHMLAEVLDRVERDYVNPVDDHQLLQAAIKGMVSSLDPYSAYLDGDEYDELKISSSGEYSGVGIEVSMEDDQVVVVSPFEGSPAAGRHSYRGRHCQHRRRAGEYHRPGRHHRAHARQGRDVGQGRHPASGQYRTHYLYTQALAGRAAQRESGAAGAGLWVSAHR
jgi:hypothetical protein